MYIPKYYKQEDEELIEQFIQQNGFATLISSVDHKLIAVHIPLELVTHTDGRRFLQGHVARANNIWRSFTSVQDLLAIFSGPHCYISPRWYQHVNVPTWNYTAVHVYGKPRIIQQPEQIFKMLKNMVDKYEADAGESPYRLEDLPKEFLDSQIGGIVAFEMSVDRIETSFKLSQNRNKEDHQTIIAELLKRGDFNSVEIAKVMAKMHDRLYK